MSNHANEIFIDVMKTLTQLVFKSPAYNFHQATPKDLVSVSIKCDVEQRLVPFLYVESEGSWDLELNLQGKKGKVSNLHWEYSNRDGEFRLHGIASNGRQMVSPTVYDDYKPLQDFYPKLKDILNGKIPNGFAFFAISLAAALSYEATSIGVSAVDFSYYWFDALKTGDVHMLDSLTFYK